MVKKIDGISVNYTDEGEGGVILLLHGWGANITLYRGIIDTLKQTHRVIAPDLPGFGKTPEPPAPWCVDDYVDFVLHFIDSFKVKSLSVVVHSFGGRVFFKMNARKNLPFTIERAVLIDSAGILPHKSLRQKCSLRLYKMGRALMSTPVLHFLYPDAVEEMRKKRGSADYNNATPLMRATLVKVVNEDLEPLIHLVQCPTLLIWGDLDTATPIGDARRMEELIADAGLVLCEGAGHFSFAEQPAKANGALRAFFE
ncbi:MAG: alpha/beta hydrolase [Bacteroidales bacterium]|nr:alpha/beta hydrolase [Bacteroidales bacterium]MCM1416763.1 alpha/beta hydrolase [bacterium]MCM1424739.1 alpha/beta hydrolase [bacterium]